MKSTRFLKVKLKSLAAEARIIRKEELRAHGDLRTALHLHRVREVRAEARSTHLAYGFLRGRTHAMVEPNPTTIPNWDKVRVMVKKYGTTTDGFEAWRGVAEKAQAA